MEAGSQLRGPREPQVELEGREAVDALGGKGATPGQEAAAGERAANGMTQASKDAALAWFMEDDYTSGSEDFVTATIEVNVGGPGQERLIPWVVRSLDQDTIQAIRDRSRVGNRRQRRDTGTEDVNEMKAATGMVAAATIDPDLEEVRKAKNVPSREMVVEHRLRHKPGLILQISGKIMEISGYDEDDVRDAIAAKNS